MQDRQVTTDRSETVADRAHGPHSQRFTSVVPRMTRRVARVASVAFLLLCCDTVVDARHHQPVVVVCSTPGELNCVSRKQAKHMGIAVGSRTSWSAWAPDVRELEHAFPVIAYTQRTPYITPNPFSPVFLAIRQQTCTSRSSLRSMTTESSF
eukprot:4721694-Pyramimonas_sp.AAC.2